MKKLLFSLVIITLVFTLSGCKKKEVVEYNIEDYMGESISESEIESIRKTSYMYIEDSYTGHKILINDINEINDILKTIDTCKEVLGDVTWEGSNLYLHLYDSEDDLIASMNIFNVSADKNYLRVHIFNNDNSKYSIKEKSYYVKTFFGSLEKYYKELYPEY